MPHSTSAYKPSYKIDDILNCEPAPIDCKPRNWSCITNTFSSVKITGGGLGKGVCLSGSHIHALHIHGHKLDFMLYTRMNVNASCVHLVPVRQ